MVTSVLCVDVELLREWVELVLRVVRCGFVLEDEAIVGCISSGGEVEEREYFKSHHGM